MAIAVAFPLVTQGALAQSTHTVQSGDTMWQISQQYDVDFSSLLEANTDVTNPNVIYVGQQFYVGQQLVIPSASNGQGSSDVAESNISQFEQEVIELTNEQRSQRGLAPLEIDEDTSGVARTKSADMRDQGYFSHNSPTYGSPFDMLSHYGVSYRGAGENIAAGQQTPEQVVNSWMNSDGHRANILNENFTHIGVGHVEGGSYGHYWTQLFITK